MDKKEMVRRIAQRTSLTQDETETALNALFGTKNGWITGVLSDALVAGESVTITGFGLWDVTTRAATTRTVPGSGRVQVASHKAVRFKASPLLRAGLARD